MTYDTWLFNLNFANENKHSLTCTRYSVVHGGEILVLVQMNLTDYVEQDSFYISDNLYYSEKLCCMIVNALIDKECYFYGSHCTAVTLCKKSVTRQLSFVLVEKLIPFGIFHSLTLQYL